MKTAEFLQSLTDARVDCVLVGGLAVQLHGHMRSTFDIDLALAMNDENLVRFVDVATRYVWLQNPALAKQGGPRVASLLAVAPLPSEPASTITP